MTDLAGAEPFPALGTTATVVVTHPAELDRALEVLRAGIVALDLACSRFRADSELSALNSASGRGPVRVSPLLMEHVMAALRGARLTGGRLDPTVGAALELVGYDRDFPSIPPDGPPVRILARPVPGWSTVAVDPAAGTVALRPGVRLDLGATAKALCADQVAATIAAAGRVGALVSLGGDIAVAGPPPAGGWPIRLSLDHADPLDGPGPVVAITEGGLASSATAVRRWRRGEEEMHHLIDPSTSRPARPTWNLVSVAAGSCLDANIASCAAIIAGADAPAWLAGLGLPARLEAANGQVTTVAGWPAEVVPCS